MTVKERIGAFRRKMEEAGVDFYLVPTADFHHSEYVSDYFKTREFLSGFTGSNGTLVISRTAAGLWTDGRYFIQADKELLGTGITLFRMQEEGVPDIVTYLKETMQEGQTLGFDGRVVDAAFGGRLEKALGQKGIAFRFAGDLAGEIWNGRPDFPKNPAECLTDSLAGESVSSKLFRVRQEMKKLGVSLFFLSRLDDLMWLFNLRGRDVACNPVCMAYGLLTETEAYLFLQKEAVSQALRKEREADGVRIEDYWQAEAFLERYEALGAGRILYDRKNTSYAFHQILQRKGDCLDGENPTESLKAVKNETELAHMRAVFLQDSVAVCKFICWLKSHVGKEALTEYTAGAYLDELRRKLPGFRDLSFPTISAYQGNAAMMHYEADAKNSSPLEPEGMLLVDSGGQYEGGTTDVTRTIVLGETRPAVRQQYTAVACGMLQLMNAKFLEGCTGRNLDVLAREPLWELGIDYKCGTGHGVGYMLNVHEGPQGIRWRYVEGVKETALAEGMTVTDEPGVYVEGSHGIRIENVLVVRKTEKNGDGQFMEFENLTWAPVDLEAIEAGRMTEKERGWLNAYHRQVYEKVSPYLTEGERAWLKEATRPV